MKSSQSKSSREIYTRLLLQKEHGYPLWIPEPDGRLPEAYRCKGVGVGDVGILRNDGGFDYLFNVCKSADDPINQGRVPNGFEPIICGDMIREIETMHKRGCDISSASVSKIEISMGGAAESPFLFGGGGGFEFKCSREKGAILVLPDGGGRYDALNISQFRSYAAQHAHAWYQFANITCGREALNGSLYLVTGCDKACSWGAASFFNPADTRSFSLKFLVGGVAEGNVKLGYSWKSTSSADVRAYPDGEFTYLVDSLRPNQCVFLRGFGISIRTSAFARWVFGPTEVSQISGSSKDQMPYFDSGMPYSSLRRKRTRSGPLSMYSGIPFQSPRKRFKKEDLLSEPVPVSPPPPMTHVLSPNHYASSLPIFPGWGADYHDEQRRLGEMRTSNNAPSQRPPTVHVQGPAHWPPNNDDTYNAPTLPTTDLYADDSNPFSGSAVTQTANEDMHVVAPSAGPESEDLEDVLAKLERELKDDASVTSSILESRPSSHGGDSAFNIPTWAPALPLTINKHDTTTEGSAHSSLQCLQYPETILMSIARKRGRGRPKGSKDLILGKILPPESSFLLPSLPNDGTPSPVKTQTKRSKGRPIPQKLSQKQRIPDPEQRQDTNLEENVVSREDQEMIRILTELPPLNVIAFTADTHPALNQEYSGDSTQLRGDSTTLSSYSFGTAAPRTVDTHDGSMDLPRSGPENDDAGNDGTSPLALPQFFSDLIDLMKKARSFQPQTELLNPCAKINEFVLETHPHVNVAITHSGEWLSALSQGDDSDVLLRVLSDYKVIVHDGVAMLEVR